MQIYFFGNGRNFFHNEPRLNHYPIKLAQISAFRTHKNKSNIYGRRKFNAKDQNRNRNEPKEKNKEKKIIFLRCLDITLRFLLKFS